MKEQEQQPQELDPDQELMDLMNSGDNARSTPSTPNKPLRDPLASLKQLDEMPATMPPLQGPQQGGQQSNSSTSVTPPTDAAKIKADAVLSVLKHRAPFSEELVNVILYLGDAQYEALPPIMKCLAERFDGRVLREYLYEALTTHSPSPVELRRFVQVSKFLQEVGPPPPMLVDRLIPDYGLILMTGKPKAGKTFMALDLADAVATGRRVFGEFSVARPGAVCYLAMEDGKFCIAERLLKRGIRAEGPHQDSRPYFMCAERFTITTPEGMMDLNRMLDEVAKQTGAEPVLLIIDTGREGLGIKDWNDPAEISDKLRPLREEIARKRCSVVIVAHNRKQQGGDRGDEIAGTNALSSSVDGWISAVSYTKLEDGRRRLIIQATNRNAESMDFGLNMDKENFTFHYVPEEELEREQAEAFKERLEVARQQAQARSQEEREQRYSLLIQAINQQEGKLASIEQIAKTLGKDPQAVRRLVKSAMEDSVVEDSGKKLPAEGRGPDTVLYRVAIRPLF